MTKRLFAAFLGVLVAAAVNAAEPAGAAGAEQPKAEKAQKAEKAGKPGKAEKKADQKPTAEGKKRAPIKYEGC